MALTITERFIDPDDPDEPARVLAELAGTCGTPQEEEESVWVTPDYASIPADADLPEDEDQWRLLWPGPTMIMPGWLLPDGKPYSRREEDNAERITGVRPRSYVEADTIVFAYWKQQRALRVAAGLPTGVRDGTGQIQEAPETIAAIVRLHQQERERRARLT